ncbi:DUF6527 family protein [Sphingomonas sp. PvP056]|uniref:DUF6527 family protein n=1 Tax=Sphingomonas sp. PvP056 TaxID=3156392 RepID=UPI00263CB43D|nr:DUF6527 family protein [Sphingomonas sp. PsM26]
MSARQIRGERAVLWNSDLSRLAFRCPGCGEPHVCTIKEGLGRPAWGWNGNLDRPTLTPSVLVTYNGPDAGQTDADGHRAPQAVCHSFVTDGRIQFLGDCTHALAGQTVDIPEFTA